LPRLAWTAILNLGFPAVIEMTIACYPAFSVEMGVSRTFLPRLALNYDLPPISASQMARIDYKCEPLREGVEGVREGVGEGGRNDPNIVCTYE
jgi:hypothetical protein